MQDTARKVGGNMAELVLVGSKEISVVIAYGDTLGRAGLRALIDAERDISVVASVGEGEEALALAREIQPDVVLVDIGLPGVDGVEVTRRLVADGGSPGTNVLILSASEGDEEVFAALRAGASGFLLRETDPAELVDGVRAVAAGEAALSPSALRRVIADLASQPDPGLPGPEQLDELTPREREVMALVAAGLTNDEIAEHLVVTRATAKTHVSRALRKLQVNGRAQLVTLAYETGLVLPRRPEAALSGVLEATIAAA